MLRHPIKRTIEQFYYRQAITWASSFDPELAQMSIQQFASSDKVVENLLLRTLNRLEDPSIQDHRFKITRRHVEFAKTVLRTKVLVGIYEWYEASIIQFENYFGWIDLFHVLDDPVMNQCHFRISNETKSIVLPQEARRGEEAFQILAARQWADLELYHFAKRLFREQTLIVAEWRTQKS